MKKPHGLGIKNKIILNNENGIPTILGQEGSLVRNHFLSRRTATFIFLYRASCVDAARYLTRFSMFSARMFAFYRGKLRRINWDCCVWVFRFKILPACSCFTYTMAGGGRRTHFFACLGHLAIHHASLSRLSTVPTPNRNSFLLETYPIFGHSARVFHIIHNTFCSPISGKIPELPLIAF